MTGADVMNLGQVQQNQSAQSGNLLTQTEEKLLKAQEAFSSLMNQAVQAATSSNSVSTAKESFTVEPASASESLNLAYDKYQYKDKSIDAASGKENLQDVKAAKEQLDSFKKDVVEAVSRELGVDEETVEKTMEQLGITVLDLLNPQQLVALVQQLTGTSDVSELLLSADFQSLFTDITQLGTALLRNVQMPLDEMQLLLQEMEVVSDFDGNVDTSMEQLVTGQKQLDIIPEQTEEVGLAQEMPVTNSGVKENVSLSEDETQTDIVSQDNISKASIKTEHNDDTNHHSQMGQQEESQQASGMVFTTGTENVMPTDTVPQNLTSYTTIDTQKIIEQMVQQVRVSSSEALSSMEMQLNPAHLGKLLLNISAKEGTVNAQIFAQNEAVKQALEAQLVNLKENLNQAGVKVDAIEVTVGTHEFERNLEQDQKKEEEQGAYQEEVRSKRRNLDVSSLDELSGIMTEEEALVAQIMKDNGNSVDLTA